MMRTDPMATLLTETMLVFRWGNCDVGDIAANSLGAVPEKLAAVIPKRKLEKEYENEIRL